MQHSRRPASVPDTPDRNDQDRQSFARFVAGDEAAFRELYSRYERPLIVYCEYLMRTPYEAQDIFQEAWLRVVRLRERGVDVENFRAMLFTIARNLALTHLGSRKNSAEVNVPLEKIGLESEWMASSDSHYDELEELVGRALNRLPVQQREAFFFHAVLGYTFHEIAEMQGSSMTAAKTRAFRARSYLRKLVSNWLGLGEDDAAIDEDSHGLDQSPHLFRTENGNG